MNEIIYTTSELEGLSDDKILEVLARSWEISDNRFEIWAELPPLSENKQISFLRNAILVKTGKRLYYPIRGEESKFCEFYINRKDAKEFGSEKYSRFIRCELELSPNSERIKHNNPFELCVKYGSVELLHKLPKEIPQNILIDSFSENEKPQFILQSIYDFYFEKAIHDIEITTKDSQKTLEEILLKKDKINENVKLLEHKRNIIKEEIKNLDKNKIEKDKEIEVLVKKFKEMEKDMNNKMQRLREYLENKASLLKKFEFIDGEDLELFLSSKLNSLNKPEGILFREGLNANYSMAVSYIQAYLVNQDILYPRHIIENYLTLLRTKDLIILAGDSGSGKTNLVKSFAKAVGGKSIVIPVKPNWTSSEDLLGYYNPLEKKYLPTPFLEALIEAEQNPEIPYFICLDEMNLARVEYYFADFLSLLETRDETPEIKLYAADEASHVLSELKAVVDIIQSTKEKYNQNGIVNFIELLKDEQLNNQLRLAFGFSDKDSLIKYHSEIRRMLSAVISIPSSIKMPANVHIIGAINIDETTHYLSPKILDRAHIMRFESPLLSNWDEILQEVESYEFNNVSQPLIFDIEELGYRSNYPKFDRKDPFCELFIRFNKEFFHKFGIEFGMRTIRQGLNYINLFKDVNNDNEIAINNFLLHKVLPKFTFDGNKAIGEQTKLELIERVFIKQVKEYLPNNENYSNEFSAISAIDNLVTNAKINEGIVNYWA